MFIHIPNLTHQHLNVAVGGKFAVSACGLEILPTLCVTEAELWKLEGYPGSLLTFGQHI